MKDFFDNFYKLLFSPKNLFEDFKSNPPLVQSMAILILVTLLNREEVFSSIGINPFSFLWILLSIFMTLIGWFIFSLFIEGMAYVFNYPSRLTQMLSASAFCFAVFLFVPVMELFKFSSLPFFIFLGVFLEFCIFIWFIYLVLKAIATIYELSLDRLIVFILLPLLGFSITISLWFGFFKALFEILTT